MDLIDKDVEAAAVTAFQRENPYFDPTLESRIAALLGPDPTELYVPRPVPSPRPLHQFHKGRCLRGSPLTVLVRTPPISRMSPQPTTLEMDKKPRTPVSPPPLPIPVHCPSPCFMICPTPQQPPNSTLSFPSFPLTKSDHHLIHTSTPPLQSSPLPHAASSFHPRQNSSYLSLKSPNFSPLTLKFPPAASCFFLIGGENVTPPLGVSQEGSQVPK